MTLARLRVIANLDNRACAAAWNQGFHASATKWTLFLNNDVVVTHGWLERLLAFAEKQAVDIVCPALGEGELNYDLDEYAARYVSRMSGVRRWNAAHGVAFAVRRSVFAAIGEFDENFRKGGNEDDDFFLRARNVGLQLAVTGGAYIHHFGSATQNLLKLGGASWREETVGYFRQKWRITWAKRRWMQFRRKTINAAWRWQERSRHGHTLREVRMNGKIYYW